VKRLIIILPFLFLGCSSSTPNVVNPISSEKTTIYWNKSHLQKMVKSIVTEVYLAGEDIFPKNKVYAFGKIKNVTREPDLNTKEIANSVITILSKEGYKFIGDYEGNYPKQKIDGLFTGILSSDYHRNNSQKKMIFRLNLNFTDTLTATNSFVFKEIEVGNQLKRHLIGW